MNRFRPKELKENHMSYILIGSGLIVLIIFFAVFFPKNPKAEAKLEEMEARLLKLEGGERLSRIEDRLASLERTLPLRIGNIEKKLDALQEKLGMSSVSTEIKKISDKPESAASESKPKSVAATDTAAETKKKTPAESKPKTMPTAEDAKADRKTARPPYHVVKSGDTLYQIARRYGMKVDELRLMNNLAPGAVLHLDQKLVLNPEKNP